ncbi:hypothetical protein L1987_54292 [Smallanthus sonchifolius]|uniref:Uncharacterized protein n=1 Tax=Smallanthus sonchifolius TaxID=185202 RepID=A0ACB9E681_9ASTR|nr:hypothetical protein L1987_54292 [Smallanthus sonchifolius]
MNTQPTRLRKSKKDKIHIEKQKTLHNLPSPELDLILGNSVHGVNQQSIQRAVANQRVRVNGPKGSPLFDLRREDIFGSQEHPEVAIQGLKNINFEKKYFNTCKEESSPIIIATCREFGQKIWNRIHNPVSRIELETRRTSSGVPSVTTNLSRISDSIAPLHNSKFDRFSLQRNLPSALNFAKLHRKRGKRLVGYCNSGEDISVCY